MACHVVVGGIVDDSGRASVDAFSGDSSLDMVQDSRPSEV